MEANKPQRYKVEVPPDGSSGSSSLDEAIVSVDDDGRLKLNSQEAGTTSDTSQLRAQIEQYFRIAGIVIPAGRSLPKLPASCRTLRLRMSLTPSRAGAVIL
jgi:hypothetical protein